LTSFDAVPGIVFKATKDNLLAEEAQNLWFNSAILRQAPLNSSMVKVIKECVEILGLKVYIVTTRRPDCRVATLEQLEKELYIKGLNWEERLKIRSQEDGVGNGDEFKGKEIERLGILHFTEDSADTMKYLHNRLGGLCYLSYINQPWNRGDKDLIRGAMRVSPNNGGEIIRRIRRITGI
jgi:hypothetical protein